MLDNEQVVARVTIVTANSEVMEVLDVHPDTFSKPFCEAVFYSNLREAIVRASNRTMEELNEKKA